MDDCVTAIGLLAVEDLCANSNSNMEITERLHTTSREQWREWLIENHSTKREIWISTTKSPDGLQYLDAVEEALCFGWIDSTIKAGEGVMWRRFSPRRKRSPWTELNKERCRRLERLGLMTDAGRAVLPDMGFQIDDDVLVALQSNEIVWQNFQTLPALYVRVRIDNIQNIRKRDPEAYQRRLQKFIDNTRNGIMYGEWHDDGRLLANTE